MHQSVNSLLVDTYIFQVDIKYDNVIAVTILGSMDNEIIPEESVQINADSFGRTCRHCCKVFCLNS